MICNTNHPVFHLIITLIFPFYYINAVIEICLYFIIFDKLLIVLHSVRGMLSRICCIVLLLTVCTGGYKVRFFYYVFIWYLHVLNFLEIFREK